MTKEDKNLLLKDICARLPYHLLGRDVFGKTREMEVIYPTGTIIAQEIDGECCSACGFVPYLRPLSSMTEEEKKERKYYITEFEYDDYWHPGEYADYVGVSECENYIDWLNEKHFDYRGLIEKGLALEAPEGMYKTK